MLSTISKIRIEPLILTLNEIPKQTEDSLYKYIDNKIDDQVNNQTRQIKNSIREVLEIYVQNNNSNF